MREIYLPKTAAERQAHFIEEIGECLFAIGKIGRFGPATQYKPGHLTNAQKLLKELGDLAAARARMRPDIEALAQLMPPPADSALADVVATTTARAQLDFIAACGKCLFTIGELDPHKPPAQRESWHFANARRLLEEIDYLHGTMAWLRADTETLAQLPPQPPKIKPCPDSEN